MKQRSLTLPAAGLALFFALAACDGDAHGDAHADLDIGHKHPAPHGGMLVELGDHAANVELLADAGRGSLTLYALGPHASEAVRLSDVALEVEITLPDGPLVLSLAAVARELTGETVGDSSEFSVIDPRLIGLFDLQGRIPSLEIRGESYVDVRFPAVD